MQYDRPKKTPDQEMIFGRHPVMDALEAKRNFEKIILAANVRGPFEKDLRKACKELDVPLQTVPKERLNNYTRKNHQGVVALLSPIPYYQVEDLLLLAYEKGKHPLFVLLDGVTDVRNIGAIARSAEAAGADALIIPKKGSAQINDSAMKSSAGALNHLPVCRVNSLIQTAEYLQMNGLQLIAADLQGEKMLYDLELNLPLALIMGDEHKGVNRVLLEKVDEHFLLPMRGQTDSFNVSVATGITLYEIMRQQK